MEEIQFTITIGEKIQEKLFRGAGKTHDHQSSRSPMAAATLQKAVNGAFSAGLDESTGSWSVGRLVNVVFSVDGQFPDA